MDPEASIRRKTFFNKSKPTIIEVIALFVIVALGSLSGAMVLEPYIHTDILMTKAWLDHIPMFLIPYIWYRVRVAPTLPHGKRSLWVWSRESGKVLFRMSKWFVPFIVLLDIPDMQTDFEAAFGTVASAISVTVFQCVFVGLTEEMMIRPALQLPLSRLLFGRIQFKRLTLSYSLLLTAGLFGLMHLLNMVDQPVLPTLLQAIFAFFIAVVIGYYYESTRNYLGAAILHGITDGLKPILILLLTALHHL